MHQRVGLGASDVFCQQLETLVFAGGTDCNIVITPQKSAAELGDAHLGSFQVTPLRVKDDKPNLLASEKPSRCSNFFFVSTCHENLSNKF